MVPGHSHHLPRLPTHPMPRCTSIYYTCLCICVLTFIDICYNILFGNTLISPNVVLGQYLPPPPPPPIMFFISNLQTLDSLFFTLYMGLSLLLGPTSPVLVLEPSDWVLCSHAFSILPASSSWPVAFYSVLVHGRTTFPVKRAWNPRLLLTFSFVVCTVVLLLHPVAFTPHTRCVTFTCVCYYHQLLSWSPYYRHRLGLCYRSTEVRILRSHVMFALTLYWQVHLLTSGPFVFVRSRFPGLVPFDSDMESIFVVCATATVYQ